MDAEIKTFLTVNGSRLECQWIGRKETDRPVLVLLHEGLGCVGMWRDFPTRLSRATGLPVFLYSRQGYGGSDPFEGPLAVDFMHREALDVLPGVLDEAGINQAVLVGHSDGGSIALIYAGARSDDRIKGVALLAPHLFVEPETLHGIRQAREQFENGNLSAGLRRYHGDHTEDTFRRWCGIWLDPAFAAWNIESTIPGIRVPVLGVMGKDDQYGTVAQLEALAAILPELTELNVLTDCGHSPHLEQREKTLVAIGDFLKKRQLTGSDS